MNKRFVVLAGVMLLGACSAAAPAQRCPVAADLAPSLDPAWFADLTTRLSGPDRENSIIEAVRELHNTHPEMGSAMVADVLIAADCPDAARAGLPEDGMKARIATLRGQVEQMLSN